MAQNPIQNESMRRQVNRGRTKSSARALLCLLLLVLTLPLLAFRDIPAPTNSYIYVEGGLSGGETRALDRLVKELNAQAPFQLAVVVLKSLEGGEIQDQANRTLRAWGVGDAKKNNGLLLLVSLEERKAWLEVGYGLEGELTDSQAARLLRDNLIPSFREGRYYEGIEQTLFALADHFQLQLEESSQTNRQVWSLNRIPWRFWVLLPALLAFLAMGRQRRWRSTPAGSREMWLWLLLSMFRSGGGGGWGGRGGGGGSGFGGFGGGSSGGGGGGASW